MRPGWEGGNPRPHAADPPEGPDHLRRRARSPRSSTCSGSSRAPSRSVPRDAEGPGGKAFLRAAATIGGRPWPPRPIQPASRSAPARPARRARPAACAARASSPACSTAAARTPSASASTRASCATRWPARAPCSSSRSTATRQPAVLKNSHRHPVRGETPAHRPAARRPQQADRRLRGGRADRRRGGAGRRRGRHPRARHPRGERSRRCRPTSPSRSSSTSPGWRSATRSCCRRCRRRRA